MGAAGWPRTPSRRSWPKAGCPWAGGGGAHPPHAAAAGLPVAEGRVADSPDDAAAVLGELGGPVALKLSRPGLTHKSEAGALVLDGGPPAPGAAETPRPAGPPPRRAPP